MDAALELIYEDFAQELQSVQRRCAGRPRAELVHLLLLALEREELVSVAYRERLMLARLRRMPVAPEVRELVRHAFIWAWKDEEMHAVYLRGAIFQVGTRGLRAQAYLRQLVGALGGWASSVNQHLTWREAPVSRSLAATITAAGLLLGQVPPPVRRYLRHGPFRDFCAFNETAERTAWLCYARLLQVVPQLRDAPPEVVEDIRHILDDEDRHRRVFATFRDAFDERDRLVTGTTVDDLAQRIAEIGEVFLPRSIRAAQSDHPVGAGGRVWVLAGSAAADKLPLFRRLLDDSGLRAALEARAHQLGRPLGDLRVAIKAAFMMGYHRRDLSLVTDPALVAELARALGEWGCREAAVVEARNLYDIYYQHRSVHEVARYLGYTSDAYRVVDLSDEQVPHAYARGMAQYTVGRTWKEADFRIVFGKMRSHPVDTVFLAVGSMEGAGARCEDYLFAERQAQRDTSIMMLLDEFPPHYTLLDAYDSAADGLLGVMGCPRPPAPRRLYASGDPLALDLVAARDMGLDDPTQSSLLRTACHWFGNPSERIRVEGLDQPLPRWRSPQQNELSALLSLLAYPMYQFGSGRGALFVPEMDPEMFPPLKPVHWRVRATRRALQILLGLRHPAGRG